MSFVLADEACTQNLGASMQTFFPLFSQRHGLVSQVPPVGVLISLPPHHFFLFATPSRVIRFLGVLPRTLSLVQPPRKFRGSRAFHGALGDKQAFLLLPPTAFPRIPLSGYHDRNLFSRYEVGGKGRRPREESRSLPDQRGDGWSRQRRWSERRNNVGRA